MDEAWLQQWRAIEERKAVATKALLSKGESLPLGGITDDQLHAWEAAEAAEEQRAQAAEVERLAAEDERLAAEAKAETKAAKAKEMLADPESAVQRLAAECKAKEQAAAEAEAEQLAFEARMENDHDGLAEAIYLELDKAETAQLAAEANVENDTSGPVVYDPLDDDDEFSRAMHLALQEELDLPEETEEAETEQPSVVESGESKPANMYPIRIWGYKNNGNARRALAKAAAQLDSPVDMALSTETGVGVEDEDQALNNQEKKASVQNLPTRLRMDPTSDLSLGSFLFDTFSTVEEKERHERFVEIARKIICFLKSTASDYLRLDPESKKTAWKPIVPGLLSLLSRGSEDFLLENLLSGIDIPVRSTLGNPDFTIDDLVSLPGWSIEKNIEKSVYVDIVHIKEQLELIRQLYVGAASGQFGLAQRWHDYLRPAENKVSGKHGQAIMKTNSTVCLRGLAHYGNMPYPWVVCFAESFMLYLGTVTDPGWRPREGSVKKAFIDDELYRLVEACRHGAGLSAPLSVGLNSTWSLCQGYRWTPYPGASCRNCKRQMVPRSDPL